MFVSMTGVWRKRAAAFVAALYVLCLLVPATAFAFSPAPAHCLKLPELSQPVSDHHAHHHDGLAQAGMTHDHDDHGTAVPAAGDPPTPAKCCGLFCVTALAADVTFVAAPVGPVAAVASRIAVSLHGRGFDRIDRPPRSFASL